MRRYLAIDSGKFATKVAEYNAQTDTIRKFSILTKAGEGDFRDDAIEAHTVIVEIDGKAYKVGNGARGIGASLDTDKKTDVHRLCTLTAIATVCSASEEDEIYCAVGLPAKEWANVAKRIDYKDYILPEGKMSIKIKTSSTAPVIEKNFTIKGRYVFPESIGALFMDETIEHITPTSITGVLDIGNLNLNATLWQGTELLQDKSLTADLGGAMLIQELSQEISTTITPCDELITAHILKSGNRQLPSDLSLTAEQVEESKMLISRVLKEHAEKVKKACRARNWSLDVTKIVAIGGTADLIKNELSEVFGNITILPETPYCNAFGYLRIMCSQIPEIGKVIPLVEGKTAEDSTARRAHKDEKSE